ncbi:GNAT family N-acetyltransferase [Pelomonas sp. KK5]|uniref:GNAT family N-acetyltransferase n=1 Tax=Pelomonas sp. KK5 TaxID=1855730 RepID=UPI00097C62CE|nr:GNAT family N-acetyltransferase [Pelomonas sp. KK5]
MPKLRIDETPAALSPTAWNALLDASDHPTPFMRHEYLLALHESRSAVDDTGWQPLFLSLWSDDDDEALLAVCPAYLKGHSYGEYVFDWAWADAYRRHGLEYYPKLLVAVPFTPVPGSRLLARDAKSRALLAQGLQQLAEQQDLSSAHLLFGDEADQAAATKQGWMARSGVQFHWTNGGHVNFTDFLAAMQREKRKKIQQEQRKVREAGIVFETREGTQITEADWDFFYRCYTLTYRAHHSTPYLTRDFFRRMAAKMAENWLLFVAKRGEDRIACSLIALDPQRGHAYGRYWGAVEHVPNLHFDACYYQPLAWCIEHQYQRFEGGAQGEHKMARGLMPVPTHSSHWLAHPDFRNAVGDFLAREGQGMRAYVNELEDHSPFKA